MTIVPFPNNFDTYLQNAMNEIMTGHFDHAVEFIDAALAIKMDEDLLNMSVGLLQNHNQFEKALYLLNTYKRDLYTAVTVGETDLLLITLLIETGNFSEAEKQINQRWATLKNKKEYAYIENILETYLEQIAIEKKCQIEAKVEELHNESETISQKSYLRQVDFVKSLPILTDFNLEKIVRPLLIDEAIHPLIKTEILTLLTERKIESAFQVSKHGITGTVEPHAILQPDDSPFYIIGTQLIDSEDGKNIIEMQNQIAILFLHTLYFYPLENRFFPDSKRWLQAITHPGNDSEYDFYIVEVEKGLDLLT